MAKHNIGPKNGMWKGGRTITQKGYVLIRVGKDHHLADVRGYAYEHRLVAEKKLGRELLPGEVVHHKKKGILGRKINTGRQLEIFPTAGAHMQAHAKRKDLRKLADPNFQIECACGCGRHFFKFDRWRRPRRFISGHNLERTNGR